MKKIYATIALMYTTAFVNAQWNGDTFVNLKITNLPSTQITVVGTHDGKTWVTFYSFSNEKYFIRAQLLDINGYKLFSDSGILVSENGSSFDTVFCITADAQSNLIVCSQYDKAGIQTTIINKISPSGEKPWGVYGVELGPGFTPWPTVLAGGDIIAAWNNGSIINYQKVHPDGSLSWLSPKIISTSDSIQSPSVIAHTNNTFGIIFQRSFDATNLTHLYEQRFDSAGNTLWADPLQFSNYGTGLFQYYEQILADHDITYMAYFGHPSGEKRYDGFVQRINADGTLPWGINGSPFADYSTSSDPYERKVQMTYDSASSILWAIAGLTDSSEVNSGISVQKFNAQNGSRLLGNNAKEVFPVSSNGERQASYLSLCDGEPLFIFDDITKKLFATKLDNAGNFAWSPTKTEIGSSTKRKGNYSFTHVYGGKAIAVWQEKRDNAAQPYAQDINCDGSTGVLPISLTNFHGSLSGGIVKLFWNTNTENNNKGFVVGRSTDGINYSKIGFVASKAYGGNSTGIIEYATTDVKCFNGNNYYRLEQQDLNGKSTYSNVILINNRKSFSMRMNSVYPNPVLNVLNIYIESAIMDKVSFIINDAAGKKVSQVSANISKGSNNIQVNVTHLIPGNYFIKLISKNFYENDVQHFVKSH